MEDGLLKITAQKENYEGATFTSARLNTKNKFETTYGKIEVRAKLATGGGAWPAIWMLGANINEVQWPNCGEIDIMENVANDIETIHSTLHYPDHFGAKGTTNSVLVKGLDTEFHTYTLEWTEDYIKTFIDKKQISFFSNSKLIPFNSNFFLLLNLAVGGSFGGAVSPQLEKTTFEIDYVKVYQ